MEVLASYRKKKLRQQSEISSGNQLVDKLSPNHFPLYCTWNLSDIKIFRITCEIYLPLFDDLNCRFLKHKLAENFTLMCTKNFTLMCTKDIIEMNIDVTPNLLFQNNNKNRHDTGS